MSRKIDYGLKFYREIFGLESLHFGYWSGDEPITIDALKNAQYKYIQHLINFIPKEVKQILDVGCGTGVVAGELKKSGYEVTCISPDSYQEEIFKNTHSETIPFCRTKFEDFQTTRKYDLILFCESVQYIKLDILFLKCSELLKPNSYVLVSDYFRKEKNIYYKTTKILTEFLEESKKDNFVIIKSEDITQNVIPTLDLAKMLYNQYALPTVEMVRAYFQSEHSYISKIATIFFHKKINKLKNYIYKHTTEKLDSKKFTELMQYNIFLFKKIAFGDN